MVADECAIQEDVRLKSIWFSKGKYPEIKSNRKYTSHSFFIAVDTTPGSNKGKTTIHDAKKQNSLEAIKFLAKIKHKYFSQQHKKVLLFWDNAGFHKSKYIKAWLKKENPVDNMWLELANFPPSDPRFNPTEQVIKVAKDSVTKNNENKFEDVKLAFYEFLVKKRFNVSFVEKYA